MTAAETIAAAIQKLEALKAVTSPGPWTTEDGYVYSTAPWTTPHGHKGPRSVFMAEGNYVDGYALEEHDAELIVTLHRTIDAQLAILKRDLDIRAKYAEEGIPLEAWESAVDRAGDLDLARAILGGAS